MPKYDYRCSEGHVTEERRGFATRELPGTCPSCGGQTAVTFSVTSEIHIPVHFKQVLTGGAKGGGSLRFADVHDVDSPRELARLHPDYEPFNRALSQPGVGSEKKRDPEIVKGRMADSLKEAKAILNV